MLVTKENQWVLAVEPKFRYGFYLLKHQLTDHPEKMLKVVHWLGGVEKAEFDGVNFKVYWSMIDFVEFEIFTPKQLMAMLIEQWETTLHERIEQYERWQDQNKIIRKFFTNLNRELK